MTEEQCDEPIGNDGPNGSEADESADFFRVCSQCSSSYYVTKTEADEVPEDGPVNMCHRCTNDFLNTAANGAGEND